GAEGKRTQKERGQIGRLGLLHAESFLPQERGWQRYDRPISPRQERAGVPLSPPAHRRLATANSAQEGNRPDRPPDQPAPRSLPAPVPGVEPGTRQATRQDAARAVQRRTVRAGPVP